MYPFWPHILGGICYSSKSHSYGLWCCTYGLGQPLLPDLVQKFKKQCFIPYTRLCPVLNACTRGSVIPNPRVSIKTLKKIINSSFSGGDRGFYLLDHLLVPVAQLWRGYKKTSKGRPRGEKGEQDYYAEIFPLDQVWSPWCILHFPHFA